MKLIGFAKSYGKTRVFENLNLEIADGEILAIVGPSGCGKTTLLNGIAGLISHGGVIEGKPERVGYIFQEPRLLLNLTVRENLLFTGGNPRRVDRMLALVGLGAHADKRPSALSGGERQRVAIVRAFLSDAPVLLMDEPFSALDTALKGKLMRLFLGLWEKDRRTTVFVSHDLEEAISLAKRIVVLKDGGIVGDFSSSEKNVKENLLKCFE